MRTICSLLVVAMAIVVVLRPSPVLAQTSGGTMNPLRPPAVPLIVRSPYVSTWQAADALPTTWSTFWDGAVKAITGIARIDGKSYVFSGDPIVNGSLVAPAMTQMSLQVTPTQSVYAFQDGGVTVSVDFLSPVVPTSLELQSIPLGYIFASAQSSDGKNHTVSLYFDVSGEWAAGNDATPIIWNETQDTDSGQNLYTFDVQAQTPSVLTEYNDYPQWGQEIWSTNAAANVSYQDGQDIVLRAQFVSTGALNDTEDSNQPRAISDDWPVFAYDFNLGTVGKTATSPVELALGDVRDPAVSYLGTNVPPLWLSYWPDWQHMLAYFYSVAGPSRTMANAWDQRITLAATKAGGTDYASLCALAFRQAFGATELVGTTSDPWLFLKEISSDGNVSTVDVVYPSFPVMLYSNPYMLRLELEPLLDYAGSGNWPEPYAEHDLGASYPNATGHNDGGGENMPVEESANMLIMSAAYMRYSSQTDTAAWLTQHYTVLKQWADYLLTVPSGAATGPLGEPMCNALDPQYQNQTDDFTGQIAHSSNLALKGILGIGAMGQIAAFVGNTSDAAYYSGEAKTLIGQWVTLSQNTQANHLLLTYREAGSGVEDTSTEPDTAWSLKYNAFPDQLLGLNLIPQAILTEEATWYASQMTSFGVPLDYRHTYTKDDWETWTAASTANAALRQSIISGIYNFLNTSSARVPFSDWYDTASGQQTGFEARPVVGGIFAILDTTSLTPVNQP